MSLISGLLSAIRAKVDSAYRRELQAKHDAWTVQRLAKQAVIDAQRADDRARVAYHDKLTWAAWRAAGSPHVDMAEFAVAPPSVEEWAAMSPEQKAVRPGPEPV